jgi:hypothetical protein
MKYLRSSLKSWERRRRPQVPNAAENAGATIPEEIRRRQISLAVRYAATTRAR